MEQWLRERCEADKADKLPLLSVLSMSRVMGPPGRQRVRPKASTPETEFSPAGSGADVGCLGLVQEPAPCPWTQGPDVAANPLPSDVDTFQSP